MVKRGAEPEAQEKIDYAYLISGGNKDFILTLEAENSRWTINRSSIVVGANGYRDKGICQLNFQWHSKFINSPEFQDFRKQIEYCWGVYKDGVSRGRIKTTFYGYNNRLKMANKFDLIINNLL